MKLILAKKFKDPDLLRLLYIIISSSGPDSNEKGLPIGSLTSQHFANLYLDVFDHYIKDSLRIKAYLRYMDDFILFSDEKPELHFLYVKMKNFLGSELQLQLKENATVLAPVTDGVPFLGFRIFPNMIRLKRENKKRALKKIKLVNKAFCSGKLD